ncbi:GGDEF domain-containing protein [Candidatus Chloroploca sp. Khr17]|uniref:GGDEF domain-containing protein n=1 Tax=Candidatus Chloroploca sp. Khr17 TaxID=2496869 RepID=UPI0013EE09D4|nr:GGDEF domain-containing protein [Candidatus Chloroploca sp. Khr17]
MVARLKQWFAPPVFEGDLQRTHRANLLNMMMIAALFLIVMTFFANFSDPQTPIRNFVIDIIIMVIIFYLRSRLSRGSVTFVACSALIFGFLFIIITIISDGTIRTPATSLFLLWVVMSSILFELRGFVLATIATSLAIIGLILAQHANMMPPPVYTVGLIHWLVLTITTGITGGLTYLAYQNTQQALTRAEQEVTKRERNEQLLEAANDDLRRYVHEIEHLQAELRAQSLSDPLTGLHNRRYLNEILARELVRTEREQTRLSIIVADIDHFKIINDTHGHQVGDTVLVSVASLLQKYVRGSDIACRYGGEEFLLVLFNTTPDNAAKRAEEIRQASAALCTQSEHGTVMLTISFGIATYPDHGNNVEELISKADQAMYQAKRAGRNRVTIWQGE